MDKERLTNIDITWLNRVERLVKFSIDSGYKNLDLDIEFWGGMPFIVVHLMVKLIEENERLKAKNST